MVTGTWFITWPHVLYAVRQLGYAPSNLQVVYRWHYLAMQLRSRNKHQTQFFLWEFVYFSTWYNAVCLWILKHQTLWKTSQQTSFCYKSTAIDWANFVRDIFCQYINDDVFNVKFNGDIEVDEPRFGRCSKNNMGTRKCWHVWIVGIVERKSKKIILYPVDCRPEETLVHLTDKHVEKGSRIFKDG